MSQSIKLPFWATIFTVLGVIVLCGLGTWQLQRLEWKTKILIDIETALSAEPERIQAADLSNIAPIARVRLQGSFETGKDIYIRPRTMDGKVGVHVLSPFIIGSGQAILVNRGWAAQGSEPSAIRPANGTEITGMLRAPDKANLFTPANNAEDEMWFFVDFDAVQAAKNLKPLAPVVLYLEGSQRDGEYPIALPQKPDLNNNHLGYAIFWFSLAGSLIAIYVLRFIRNTKN